MGENGRTKETYENSQETPRKNVIWFISDQHRGQALGIHGDPNVSTPNMDWLARTGCDFEMAYSGMPLCSPFRGSMLTSRYPHHCVPGHEFPRSLSGKENGVGGKTERMGRKDGFSHCKSRKGVIYF